MSKPTPPAMRYPRNHKADAQALLLANARAVAKRQGFAPTGVDTLMATLGRSGAAFYGHYASKAALFEALVGAEMAHSSALLAGDGSDAPEHVLRCLRRYLSSAHVDAPEAGCVLPTLGAEIARAGPAVQATVAQGLQQVQRSWQRRLGGDGDAAWALIAQCVGALLLARAVGPGRTRAEILGASRRFLAQRPGLAALAQAPRRAVPPPKETP